MNPFCTFMASPPGRAIRIIGGVFLVGWSLISLDGIASVAVFLLGLIPLLAGLFDFVVFAPLFGCPMSGPAIREGKRSLPPTSE